MPIIADTNLTSGEVSPTFLGRADQQRFPNAAQRIENMLLTITGMRSKRPGMQLMGFPKSSSTPVKLRRWQYSDESGNILEFGNFYMRVWATNGQVINAGAPVEVPTPFAWDRLHLLGWTQSVDFLFAIDEDQGIFVIKKHDAVTWDISSFGLIDGPYGAENADPTHQLIFWTPGPNSTHTLVDSVGFAPFGDGDVGRMIRVRTGTNPADGDQGGIDADGNPLWAWLIVSAVNSASQVDAIWQFAGTLVPGAIALDDFRLGLYSSRLGWPKTGKIHEQRLVLAGARAAPDRVDGSAIADFNNFRPTDPLVDNGAWGFALGTEDINRIVALAPNNDLIVLTTGREHHMAGDSTGAVITPTQVWQRPIAADGARFVEAVNAGITTVFVDKYGMNIKGATWDLRFANYAPDNLTKLADHMYWADPTSKGFTALAWQANPIPNIWTIRGNGELAGAVFEPRENVLGWHRHPMGMPLTDDEETGELVPAGPPPVVESIDVMRGPAYDELWAAVLRTIDGVPLRTIERMGRPGLWDYPYQRLSFHDCGLQLFNTPDATLRFDARTGSVVAVTVIAGTFTFAATDVGRFIKVRYRLARPDDAVPGYTLTGRSRWRMAIARITTFIDPGAVTVSIARAFPKGDFAAGAWGLTVSEVTGLDHFEGYYLSALVDGAVQAPKKVNAGKLELDVPGFEISVGLNYTGIYVSMPLDPGPQPVIGQGRQTRLDSVVIRFLSTVGGEFASVPETDEETPRWERMMAYDQGGAAPSEPPAATSADRKINLAGEWSRRTAIAAQQRDPLPFNVLIELNHVYSPFVQP